MTGRIYNLTCDLHIVALWLYDPGSHALWNIALQLPWCHCLFLPRLKQQIEKLTRHFLFPHADTWWWQIFTLCCLRCCGGQGRLKSWPTGIWRCFLECVTLQNSFRRSRFTAIALGWKFWYLKFFPDSGDVSINLLKWSLSPFDPRPKTRILTALRASCLSHMGCSDIRN